MPPSKKVEVPLAAIGARIKVARAVTIISSKAKVISIEYPSIRDRKINMGNSRYIARKAPFVVVAKADSIFPVEASRITSKCRVALRQTGITKSPYNLEVAIPVRIICVMVEFAKYTRREHEKRARKPAVK